MKCLLKFVVFLAVTAVYCFLHLRTPFQFEMEAYATALSSMLNCHLKNLPTEFFLHKLRQLHHLSLHPYQSCMMDGPKSYDQCTDKLPKKCSQTPGLPSPWCHNEIQKVINCFQVHDCSMYDEERFYVHRECLEDLHSKHVTHCLPTMQQACDESPVRVAKVIRLSMHSVQSLLQKDPSVKVVHLVRDPRGVLPSRGEIDPALLELHSLNRSASELCEGMLTDIHIREQLQRSHSGVFLQLKYEDLATQPAKTSQKLFDFLGIPFSDEMKSWVNGATHASVDTKGIMGINRRDSSQTALKWQSTLTEQQKVTISNNRPCQELLHYLKYIT